MMDGDPGETVKGRAMILSDALAGDLEVLYRRMGEAYDRVARALDFGCDGCPDNCCDSYFQHHTYIEWAYLWRGLEELTDEARRRIRGRAGEYVESCRRAEAAGERPQVMCPLNEAGLCTLYHHRLLVCRTHGVPAVMRLPDGRVMPFPGCFRCQEVVRKRQQGGEEIPRVERTRLLAELVGLEDRFLEGRRRHLPKLKMTIAEMILQGPPEKPVEPGAGG